MSYKRLNLLWTNADIITSEKMVLMYTTNCMLRKWWKEVIVYVWGAPAQLIAESDLIKEKIAMAQHTGVKFIACKGCTDQLGVSEDLEAIGIDVRYIGDVLTDILQDDEKLLTV